MNFLFSNRFLLLFEFTLVFLMIHSAWPDVFKWEPAGYGLHSVAYARNGRLGELVREKGRDNDSYYNKLLYRERAPDVTVSEWETLVTGGYSQIEYAALWYDHRDRAVVLYWNIYNSSFIQLRQSGESWTQEGSWDYPNSEKRMVAYFRDPSEEVHVMLIERSGGDVSLTYGRLSSDGFWETAAGPFTNFTGVSDSRNLSLMLDSSGGIHAVFSVDEFIVPVSGGTQIRSSLFYVHKSAGGSWSSPETLLSPGTEFGDAGLGASIAVASNGTIAVVSSYLPRAPTGSAGRCELRYLVKQANGSWENALVTNTSDNYSAGDGQRGSGLNPILIFDAASKPHILFSDHASEHYPMTGQSSYSGQVRYATRNSAIDGSWQIATLISRGNYIPQDFRTYPFAIASRFGQIAVSATSYIWNEPEWRYEPHYQLLTIGELSVPPIPFDSDHDGLGDEWEYTYFDGISVCDETDDFDGDGCNNLYEYVFGTNPTNVNDASVLHPSMNGSFFSLETSSVGHWYYTVESSTDIAFGGWSVVTQFMGSGSRIKVTDPESLNREKSFYRIQAESIE